MGTDTQIDTSPVLIFDGYCNLCNGFVNFIIDHNRAENIKFSSIQSDFGRRHSVHEGYDPDDPETLMLLKGVRVLSKSSAVFEVAKELNSPWRWVRVFRVLPRGLTDFIYDWVAKNRYRFFGKRDSCRLPTPELEARFIDS